MIRKKNKFARPHKPFDLVRITAENELVKKYGLKNKKEIWKAIAKVTYYRNRAKELAKKSSEEQQVLFNKLKAIGLKANSIAEVLDLKVEDLLSRRLPSVVAKKNLATTVRQARQFVVHKKILVDSKVVNTPSYIVPVSLEERITLKQRAPRAAAPAGAAE